MRLQTLKASVGAACIVADKQHEAEVERMAAELGGGWKTSVNAWKASGAPYLVMLAQNTLRIERCAPLAMMIIDPDALRECIEYACRQLNDVQCMWVHLLNPDALACVQSVTLADAIPQGVA